MLVSYAFLIFSMFSLVFPPPNLRKSKSGCELVRCRANRYLDAEYKPLAISNPPGRDSYPLVAMSWVLAYENGNGVNTDALKQTFNYMLSNPAQSQADNLGYVPLPESIRKAALDQVELIKQ